MSSYDAIVIGAGSVGVPTTYFLAREGMRVLCVDRHSSSGQGANKAAGGCASASLCVDRSLTVTARRQNAKMNERHFPDAGLLGALGVLAVQHRASWRFSIVKGCKR